MLLAGCGLFEGLRSPIKHCQLQKIIDSVGLKFCLQSFLMCDFFLSCAIRTSMLFNFFRYIDYELLAANILAHENETLDHWNCRLISQIQALKIHVQSFTNIQPRTATVTL